MPTIITQPVASDNLSTNRIRISMADKIALLDPNENPFTLLTQKMNKKAIGSTTRRWLTDVIRPEVDQINNGAGYASDTTSIVVDNGDYFKAGDLWRVHDSGEVIKITSVSTNTLTVVRNFTSAGATEPGYNTALLDNDYLEFIGNYNLEGASAPTAVHTLEVEYLNYTQIQRTSMELTGTEIKMLTHADQPLPYEAMKKGIEHQRKIEKQFLFGGKPRSIASSGATKTARLAGGLWWYLRKYGDADRVKSLATLTEDAFMTWIRHCYRYGKGKKVLYAPPLMLEAISRWAANHLQAVVTDTKFGINIKKWVHPHSNIPLVIINHKMLEGPVEGGGTNNHAFLLDMDDLAYCHVRGRDTALLTGRQANDQDSEEQEYLTESCLEIDNFAWHGYMYDFTAFA